MTLHYWGTTNSHLESAAALRRHRASAALLWLAAVALAGALGFKLADPRARTSHTALQEAEPRVTYSVWLRRDLTPARFVFNMQIPVAADEKQITIQMPVWSPGDYHIQNHGQYVTDLHAVGLVGSAQTGELPVRHPDANSWQVDAANARTILVSYSVPQTPPGIFSDNVTIGEHYAFLNGPSALAYVAAHKSWRSDIHLYLPGAWAAETALPALDRPPGSETAAFTAPNYDTLADSPIVMGDAEGAQVREFEVDKVRHRVVFFHLPMKPQEADSYVPILRRVAQAENDIMGGPPYTQYDFLFDVGGGGGGLEHLNSARMLTWPGIPVQEFQSFVAHEFFHLWNVKRIRPLVLGPFDYIHPPKTRNLWFAEGVTEYYAHVAVRRAGLTTQADFLRHWQRAIRRMQSNPARKKVTADEASLRVWESGNSEGFGGLSYYEKGELIGLCLDLKIRHATGNAKSLDDVMRLLLARHNPPKPGYGEDEIRSTVSEVAGVDLAAFYDMLARSTDEMPFAECLGYAGLGVTLTPLATTTGAEKALRESWSGVAKQSAPAPH